MIVFKPIIFQNGFIHEDYSGLFFCAVCGKNKVNSSIPLGNDVGSGGSLCSEPFRDGLGLVSKL